MGMYELTFYAIMQLKCQLFIKGAETLAEASVNAEGGVGERSGGGQAGVEYAQPHNAAVTRRPLQPAGGCSTAHDNQEQG